MSATFIAELSRPIQYIASRASWFDLTTDSDLTFEQCNLIWQQLAAQSGDSPTLAFDTETAEIVVEAAGALEIQLALVVEDAE